eukprot:74373-Prymnesium_polylepis.1
MFCTMFTGLQRRIRMRGLGEQLGRPLIGRQHGVEDRACCRQLGGLVAVSLAECIATGRSGALERPWLDVG